MAEQAPDTAAELEAFRRQWREEVEARNKKPETASSNATVPIRRQQRRQDGQSSTATGPSTARRREPAIDGSDEVEPKAYHDLPDKEEVLKLGGESQKIDRSRFREPSSALEHYERAVDKETAGQLGDSLAHYRKAFKLDDGVHEAYKMKHFPPSAFKPKPSNPNPSNAAPAVPNTAHHSLHGSGGLPQSLQQMIGDFSSMRIEAKEPPTDASPQEPSPFADLPEEILTHILTEVAVNDVAAFVRMAQVCKRLAYLVLTEESVWRRVTLGSEFGFGAMKYNYTCDIEGFSLEANDEIARYLNDDPYYDFQADDNLDLPLPPDPSIALATTTAHLLQTQYSSYLHMFRARPRIRFNGCYISTVNYTRPGATSTNTLSWGVPVHVVTYFRYLRFFRDGSCISLLTTSEPADVVHHLTKANVAAHSQTQHLTAMPSSVMKDALKGRWRLSGPASLHRRQAQSTTANQTPLREEQEQEQEDEGTLHIETEGVISKYTYKLQLRLGHAGKGTRNNKLSWKGFWSYNRLTDDWGEFGLKNDRAFYWSRVRSFGLGD
ncbi:hypothetical protein MBLNU230_g1442t1 [Neophaeotheca triangularis]